jgi:signal peptidase
MGDPTYLPTTVRWGVKISLNLLVVTALLITLLLMYWHVRGVQPLSIQSDSMAPTFRRGDAVLAREIAANDLRTGQVVSYHSLQNQGTTITHRLMSVNTANGWLTTQGDALDSKDPAFPPQQLIGQATTVLPHGGTLLGIFRSPLGLAVSIYIPALVIFVQESRHLIASMLKRPYRLYGFE